MSTKKKKPDPVVSLRVALLIESSRSYGRELLKGIAAYGRTHGSWTFFHQERAFGDLIPPRLKEWKPHGIIARLAGARVTRQIMTRSCLPNEKTTEARHVRAVSPPADAQR